MIRALCVLCLLCASAVPAIAAPTEAEEKARALASEGETLFNQDDFRGAITKFEEAYALHEDPAYLFNIAQAYRLAGDCENAAAYYKRFLDDVPDPPSEETIRAWYVSQLECVTERSKQAKTPPPVDPSAPPPAEPVASSTSGMRIASYALAGTSVVAFGVGGYFLWDAGRIAGDRDDALAACTPMSPCAADAIEELDRRGRRANTIALIGFVAGGAALGTAIALFVLDPSAGTETPVAVTPLPGGAAVSASLAW